ncbi:MAG: T9SS type A sorting domain-containing protein, partial [Bacteroidota bacterium]
LTQCFDRDTVLISLVSEDLIIENIISDSTQCEGLFSELEFKVRNLGTTNYTKGRKIPMGYIIDGYQAVNDTIALDDNLLGYGTTNVSLKKISSIPLGENLMKVYMQLPGDMNHANDTLNVMFNLNKSPEIDLGGNEDGLKNVQFPHVLNPNKTEQYTFYLWQDGETTPAYTATSEGLYWVRVTNNEGCTVTDSVILQKTNSIGRYISGSGVTLHPNPANESLHVHFTIPGLKNPVIQITDLTGKVIMEYKLPAPKDDQLKLDVSQLPTGVYYLKVFNNEKFIVEKFVVKRK